MMKYCFILIFWTSVAIGQNLSTKSNIEALKKRSFKELDSLVLIPFNEGNFSNCFPFMEAAREKARMEFGTQDSTYALYTNHLGFVYEYTDQFPMAEKLYLEAKSIRQKLFGEKHVDYATSLNNLSALFQRTGRYNEAEALALETIQSYAAILGKTHPYYAICLDNLAAMYCETGNYAQAEPLMLEAKSIYKQTLDTEFFYYVENITDLATLYCLSGKYTEAEQLYLEAKALREEKWGKEHPAYGQILNNLASLYRDKGNYKKALEMYLEAKKIQAKTLGLQNATYAVTIENLADLYESMKDFKQAEILRIETKNIREKTLGKHHPHYIECLIHLAVHYNSVNRNTDALNYLKEAINNSSMLNMSMIVTEAWADSLATQSYLSTEHIQNMTSCLSVLYQILREDTLQNNKNQLVIVAGLANRLLKKTRDGFTNEKDKLRILEYSHDWMLRSLEVLDLEKQAQKALEVVELNKASLLLEAAKAENAYQLGNLPDSLAEEEKKLFKKQAQLEANILENRNEKEKDSLYTVLNVLGQDMKKFRNKIEKEYPQYVALKYKQSNATIQDIQKSLKNEAAFLEYVVGDSAIYIFYIDRQNVKILEQKISSEELNSKIAKLQNALSDYHLLEKNKSASYQQYTENAYWFYQKIIQPVLSNSKNIKQLIIVTDGNLGHLPFETFLVEQAKQGTSDYSKLHYLVKDYRISYNYSATLFVEATGSPKRSNNGQILGIAANYEIKLDANKTNSRLPVYQRLRKDLGALPAAKKEVEILATNFNGFFAFDKMASEQFFKTKASNYAIIHLAMHGLLDDKAPILSSLAFTEDGDSVENNFLQAFEISKMKLNADLVVLSACETGYGKFEKGNGIASLARAFVYAGAPALVVSLWQVNDYSTAEIMKFFYENLTKGMSKDEALQQAKLSYLNIAQSIAAHPAFWSAFILIGDESPVQITKKTNYIWWGIAGLAVLVLGGGLFAFRKKQF